ncbi:S1 family peptidase [Actibacterium pelagium]|uniref:S1 family peptidase n=1 Tax=Actibacterium pelagium TaxID=2029103 RepID=UPI001177363D|nr:serine protease [Actibacterium pelagium]
MPYSILDKPIETAIFDRGRDFVLRVKFRPANTLPTGGILTQDEVRDLDHLEPSTLANENQLTTTEQFTLVAEKDENLADWDALTNLMVKWLSQYHVPWLEELNSKAVHSALPPAPTYQIEEIEANLWVVNANTTDENGEFDPTTGTAFSLADQRIVTCRHVLGDNLTVHKPQSPSQTRPARVTYESELFDLAILEIDQNTDVGLPIGSGDDVKRFDHLLVAGFPNFRLGDRAFISPGVAVGFRTSSAIRRIMTNARIVSGNSGGPALNADGKVIGICATGGSSHREADLTEDTSIIPIEVLKLSGQL